MAYQIPGCIICRVDWHYDVKCWLCEERVCNQTNRTYDGEYFCASCWAKGSKVREVMEEEIDRHSARMKALWDEWSAKPGREA